MYGIEVSYVLAESSRAIILKSPCLQVDENVASKLSAIEESSLLCEYCTPRELKLILPMDKIVQRFISSDFYKSIDCSIDRPIAGFLANSEIDGFNIPTWFLANKLLSRLDEISLVGGLTNVKSFTVLQLSRKFSEGKLTRKQSTL